MVSPNKARPLFNAPLVGRAIVESFYKLDPRREIRNRSIRTCI